jgi:hypothetical protein
MSRELIFLPELRRNLQWLLCVALALPGILVPQFDYMGPNRVRYTLGWPVPSMDILVGGIDDGHILHFQPDLGLLLAAALWVFVIHFAWRARRWAIDCSHWRGAAVQALLTALYCILMVAFLYGATHLISDWRLFNMESPELDRAFRFQRRWFPYLYALGAGGALVVLLADSLRRRFSERLFHLAAILWLCYGFWCFSPVIKGELQFLDRSIQDYAQKQPMEHR